MWPEGAHATEGALLSQGAEQLKVGSTATRPLSAAIATSCRTWDTYGCSLGAWGGGLDTEGCSLGRQGCNPCTWGGMGLL